MGMIRKWRMKYWMKGRRVIDFLKKWLLWDLVWRGVAEYCLRFIVDHNLASTAHAVELVGSLHSILWTCPTAGGVPLLALPLMDKLVITKPASVLPCSKPSAHIV